MLSKDAKNLEEETVKVSGYEVKPEEQPTSPWLCVLAEGEGREWLNLREDVHVNGEGLNEYFWAVQKCTVNVYDASRIMASI